MASMTRLGARFLARSNLAYDYRSSSSIIITAGSRIWSGSLRANLSSRVPGSATCWSRDTLRLFSTKHAVFQQHQQQHQQQQLPSNDKREHAPVSPSQPSPSSQPNTNGNAVEVHENIYTVPNFLTLSRILASPYIGYLIVHQHYQSAMIGCLIFGATDVLDGYIARRFNSRSVLGSIMDPFADKVLVTTLVISMAWNTDNPLLPLPLAAIILGRDLGLIISAFYFRYISLPPPKTLVRFFDVTLPSAEVRPTTISKVNTVLQVGLLAASLAAPATGLWELDDTWMSAFRYLVGTTTVLSGLSYVFSKDAVRIVAQTKKPKL